MFPPFKIFCENFDPEAPLSNATNRSIVGAEGSFVCYVTVVSTLSWGVLRKWKIKKMPLLIMLR